MQTHVGRWRALQQDSIFLMRQNAKRLARIQWADRRGWHNFMDLVFQNAKAGLRAEASRGYLGVLWWILEPLMYMSVFYVVFAHLLHRGDESFIVFLLTGLIVWKWFHATINTGANSLINNANLMKQVYLPKIVFPLTIITTNTFKFLIILSIFLIFLQFTPTKPTITWTLLPVLVSLQLLLILGFASLLAAIMPFFPDLKMILDNVLMMFLFLSGIFFDVTQLPASIQRYLLLNPMANLIVMYREILLDGSVPDLGRLMFIFLLSLFFLLIALLLFRRFDRVYPKIIH